MRVRVIFVFAVVVLAPIFVTAQNQPSGAQKRDNTQQASPSPPVSVNCNCTTQAENGKDKPQGWHKFVTWPEGIATWALILTLGGIFWQAIVSKTAARAAQQNIELIIRKERARLSFEIGKPPKRSVGDPLYITFTVQHDGPTSAFNVKSQTNAVVSDSYDSPKNEFLKLRIGLPNVVPPSYGTKMFSRKLLQIANRCAPLPLDDETLKQINEKRMFIHFWGFIKYTDFFDRPRETTFRYRLVTGVDEDSIEYWETYGPPEDNHQT